MDASPAPLPPRDGDARMPPPDGAARMVQDLSRYSVPAGFRGRSAIVVQLWWLVQSTLFGMSPQFLYGWRNFLLRAFGCKVGRGTIVRPSVRITYPWKVTIGERCQIGDGVELYSLGPIRIGDDVVVSQRSYLCTGSHDHRSPSFDIYTRPVLVEDQAWIAADCFVYPGVTIGRGAVVAARSTVNGPVEPYAIYAGNPATRTGERTMRTGAALTGRESHRP